MGLSEKRKRSKLHIDQIPYFKAFNDTMGSQISIGDKVKKSLLIFLLYISEIVKYDFEWFIGSLGPSGIDYLRKGVLVCKVALVP